MMTDPVADMLTRIRNAIIAKHESADIPLSKLKLGIAQILKDEGFIADFDVETEDASLKVRLKWGPNRDSAIIGLRRASRPGRRLYVKHRDLPKVLNGMGVSIISTSRGLLTDRDAEKHRVGGEVLCEVW